ncbi:MAG TPA: TonB-dependent receptor [Methylocystis sp.]|nr:TonB-dependent receptor [Methylocystis sp.]
MSRSTTALRARLMRGTRLASVGLVGVVFAHTQISVALAQATTSQNAAPTQAAAAPVSDGAAPAAAAASAQVEEVKVTSRLREEKAQDVPLPVSVVGPKTAEREHIERLTDFAQKVPNFVPYISNPRTSAMTIRGISGISGGADGSESAVGLIVDNVFYTHVGFQWADFVDLQSLEVARGPQGTLLGKNTTVGAVVIHTQAPSFEPSASIESSFGNRERFTEKYNFSGPVIPDELAYRATFFLDKSDGVLHDEVTGAGLLNNNRWGARGQLLYTHENLTDRLIFDRTRSDEYNNYSGVIGNTFPFYANGAPVLTYAQNLLTRIHWPYFVNNPYEPALTRLGNLDQRITGLSNEANYAWGDNTLTSVSAWRELILHPRNSLGNDLTQISGNAFDVKVDQFSQEVRVASPKDQTIEWQTGIYSLYENITSYDHTDYGYQAEQFLNNAPAGNPAILNGVSAHSDGKARTFSIAPFGQSTYHIDEQWALTAGLRNSFEIREGSDFGWVSGCTVAGCYAATQAAYGATFYDTGGQNIKHNSLSGLLNPSYRFNENILAYASVARGEKSGAINTAALPLFVPVTNVVDKFQPLITKAEVSWDYEFGVKTNWLDNRLILNGNFYWNDIYNFQSILVDASIINPTTGVPLSKSYLGNIGQVRLRGFEFDGRYSPIERLWITFSGALTDARYVQYTNAAPPPDWLWPATANVGGVAAPLFVNLSGQRITGGVTGNAPVAPYSFNIGANYEHPLGNVFKPWGTWADTPVSATGYFNVAWKYKEQLNEPLSIYPVTQPSFAIVNAGIGLKTDDDKYTLQFFVRNLFDTRYVIAQAIGGQTAPQTVTYGENAFRWFGGTLRVKFF